MPDYWSTAKYSRMDVRVSFKRITTRYKMPLSFSFPEFASKFTDSGEPGMCFESCPKEPHIPSKRATYLVYVKRVIHAVKGARFFVKNSHILFVNKSHQKEPYIWSKVSDKE